MSASKGYESPGIAGSGAIATGLAAVSTTTADTILLARSEASAWRAEEKVVAACAKIEGAEPSRLRVTTDPADSGRVRRRRRGRDRGARAQGRGLIAAVAAACPERRPRHDHLLPRHRRDRRRRAGVGSPLRPARLQSGAADEAGRGLLPRRCRGGPREGAGLVRGARQDRGRGSRSGRLRRQPPALPLPLRRGADDRAHRDGGRARSTPA